jgi:hypothetical protein
MKLHYTSSWHLCTKSCYLFFFVFALEAEANHLLKKLSLFDSKLNN